MEKNKEEGKKKQQIPITSISEKAKHHIILPKVPNLIFLILVFKAENFFYSRATTPSFLHHFLIIYLGNQTKTSKIFELENILIENK